jgi:hypothetical protein
MFNSSFLKSPRNYKSYSKITWDFNKFQRRKWLDTVDESDKNKKNKFCKNIIERKKSRRQFSKHKWGVSRPPINFYEEQS